MSVYRKFICLSIFLLTGCGIEFKFMSTGVSLGGTGDPDIETNLSSFKI